MKLKSILCLVCVSVILASCGSKKQVVATTKKPKVVIVKTNEPIDTIEEGEGLEGNATSEYFLKKLEKENPRLNKKTLQYIRKFYPIAVSEMYVHKIPASITLAQGILESGNGFSDLATRSNNHFGIKCHRGWSGEKVYHDDDEKGECFRKYQHPDTSYKDHSQFLVGRSRYASLFNLKITDYKRWAKGLRRAGYATDRKYPQKLIGLIERYKLYNFDTMQLDESKEEINPKQEEPTIVIENTIGNYYEVKKGDTLYSIAKKHNTSVKDLKEINGLPNNSISIGQHLLLK